MTGFVQKTFTLLQSHSELQGRMVADLSSAISNFVETEVSYWFQSFVVLSVFDFHSNAHDFSIYARHRLLHPRITFNSWKKLWWKGGKRSKLNVNFWFKKCLVSFRTFPIVNRRSTRAWSTFRAIANVLTRNVFANPAKPGHKTFLLLTDIVKLRMWNWPRNLNLCVNLMRKLKRYCIIFCLQN